jgi:hypothetical protein
MFPIVKIQNLKDKVLREILVAVHENDTARLDRLNSHAQRLEALLRTAIGVNDKFQRLTKEVTQATATTEGMEPRKITIGLTAGMIRNHMLVITPYNGQIDDQEPMRVITRFSAFDTIFLRSGNKLQERSGIRKFYEGRQVDSGDSVTLQEIRSGKWYLDTSIELSKWVPVPAAGKSGIVKFAYEGYPFDSTIAEVVLREAMNDTAEWMAKEVTQSHNLPPG